jgi:hypothetical protein
MNRFLFLFFGIILFCLAFGMLKENYFFPVDKGNFNPDLIGPKKTIEVQAQKIDLKKSDMNRIDRN